MATDSDASVSGLDGPRLHPRVEVERLRDEAARHRSLSDRRAGRWVKVEIALGFPAALLAGVSGATGLASADARIPAALMALTAAGLAAGAAFLRSDARRRANKRARQAWAAVEDRAGRLLVQDSVSSEDLDKLYALHQAALAAYEGVAVRGEAE
ncbi:hypothetical protein I3F58_00375 [Streptomyces sp. MUM 203J]|uniref:hypothetical protein n=1 Tax=Streptomyces sp. MUM 203J TaxID=2791990 RepID=UPI001F04C4FD|nr:hypothetical protein [Streptomyces sp. MUM 203J]MCH0538040.1 hypothetical protein [Streptomyces sp. MUM 203J]